MIAVLADHHAGAVIDEEARADRRARMDVDPRAGVGQLRDDPRNDHRAELEQRMRDAMVQDRERAGVGDQYLVDAARGWIADESRLEIAVDQRARLGQRHREMADDRIGMAGVEGVAAMRLPIVELERDLLAQDRQPAGQPLGDEIILARRAAAKPAEPHRVERGGEMLDRFGHLGRRRETRDAGALGRAPPPGRARRVERGDRIRDLRREGCREQIRGHAPVRYWMACMFIDSSTRGASGKRCSHPAPPRS